MDDTTQDASSPTGGTGPDRGSGAVPAMRVTDPARIRALTHPVRLDILEILDDVGQATATQCAERLGETVANCSFHLRSLAKAGFIEPAPVRGREKPWRPVAHHRSMDYDPTDPASGRAMGEMAGLMVLREAERVRDFLQRNVEQPEQWRDTVSITTAGFWATADEMRALVQDVQHLTDRYAGRWRDPSLRPAGARPGRLFATINPDDYLSADDPRSTDDPRPTDDEVS
ncbi:transcriptional regulator [Actinotalea sp. K2]|uniref:ArsR/SmtB family transcription factor n=1 Tax=Actinotalea sp. K2 TaxID=2939438 RepID=UPI0020178298|nr:helix-turn-helix domain-containing protein [Actinotalea sp. K2]MCL3862786.1 helix-turn-helix domain-containing protein [Actinotalea sp. K2]